MNLPLHSHSLPLTDIYIQVNNYIMKPLEEYMLFTKTGADNITVINSQGVRSAQCNSHFEIDGGGIVKSNANESVVSIVFCFVLYNIFCLVFKMFGM